MWLLITFPCGSWLLSDTGCLGSLRETWHSARARPFGTFPGANLNSAGTSEGAVLECTAVIDAVSAAQSSR